MADDENWRKMQNLQLESSSDPSSNATRAAPNSVASGERSSIATPNFDNEDNATPLPMDISRPLHAASDTPSLESAPHRRTGISFNPLATTDEGYTWAIGSAAPGLSPADRTNGDARSLSSSIPSSSIARPARNSSAQECHSVSDVPSDRVHSPAVFEQGESRWPLLQSTVDQLAREQVSLQTDQNLQADASPMPRRPDLKLSRVPAIPSSSSDTAQALEDTSDSPSTSSFPSMTASGTVSSPQSRDNHYAQASQGERPSAGAMRRASRRASTRSASGSAKSPASAFLSRFSRDSSSARAEPDDDGQAFGDNNEYIIGKRLGFGGFSVVKEAHSLENGQPVVRAVKIVRKQIIGRSEEENEEVQATFDHEVSIWRHLRHNNILPLLAVFDTSFATFCIIPIHRTGTLFDLVRARRQALLNGPQNTAPRESESSPIVEAGIPVPVAQNFLMQLASALRYLHEDMKIVHRDIKLENCLITTSLAAVESGQAGDLMLCDFGMSDFVIGNDDDQHEATQDSASTDSNDGHGKRVEAAHNIGPAETSTNFAGSLPYASPELINSKGPVKKPCVDMWAFGVLAYTLFTAKLPFNHALPALQLKMILEGDWSLTDLQYAAGRAPVEAADPPSIIDLVQGCLQLDEAARWTIKEVQNGAFLSHSRASI